MFKGNMNQISEMQKGRPPLIRFEQRSEQDMAASEKEGRYVGKTVDFICITPAGSKDVIEKIADEWLPYIRSQAMKGQYDPSWAESFSRRYQQWKDGMEVPPSEGTSVREWAAINRAQAEMLIAVNIYTIEDLAVANEQSLDRVGMGARMLKTKAQKWLETASDTGKNAERIVSLEAQLSDMKTRNEQLEKNMKDLLSQVSELSSQQTLTLKKRA